MALFENTTTAGWSNMELYNDMALASNATTGNETTTPVYLGFISAGVAVLFYGSNFIPVKKFETGDGMFFQLVLCTAILLVGIVVNLLRNAPKLYPIVMVGGVIWATGNICVVPIIKTIGMGLGLCIWGCTNLLSGWATGRFGTFGLINPEIPSNTYLNYGGVFMAVVSGSIFLFVRSEVSTSIEITVASDCETVPLPGQEDRKRSVPDVTLRRDSGHGDFNYRRQRDDSINSGWLRDGPISEQITQVNLENGKSFIDQMSPFLKRIVGSVMALISGIFYGVAFLPAIHVQDRYPGASQNGLDYVFAHFLGIFFASVVYFVIYAAFMKNVPKVYPKAILPALLSGIMWGIATTCWFVANKVLSEPVSFPIITTGPGVVASIWGVVVFKEIRGRRNLVLLFLAFIATLTCGILSGLSDA